MAFHEVSTGGAVNVGIGIDNPKANLQVHQTTAPSIEENSYNDGLVLSYDGGYNEGDLGPGISFAQRWHNGTANSFVKTGAIHGYKGTANGVFGGGLQFYSINSGGGGLIERMRIDNVGNVGIGTTNPSANLITIAIILALPELEFLVNCI